MDATSSASAPSELFETCPCRFERPSPTPGDATFEPAQLFYVDEYQTMRFVLLFIISAVLLLVTSCGSTAETNSTSTNTSDMGNGSIQNVDPNALPPGLSASPISPLKDGAPGIPSSVNTAVNALPKGATPTPGIPDPRTAAQPLKPGATPTPGIPDPETLKRQMEEIRKAGAANINQPPTESDAGNQIRKKPRSGNNN